MLICCVFRPANGCFAHCLLVQILCFCVKQVFPFFNINIGKKEKRKGSAKTTQKSMHKRGVHQHLGIPLKRWLTPKSWSTPKSWLTPEENIDFDQQTYMEHLFGGRNTQHTFILFASFLLFSSVQWKKILKLEKIFFFNQQTAIEAPLCRSKYTTD